MSVVEFIVQLKARVKIWLVDVALRIVTPVWGFAGVITFAVFLGLSPIEVPVSCRYSCTNGKSEVERTY